MAPPETPGDEEKNDVLSNLPRSRRQRPSARREEAKASRKAPASPAPNGKAPKAPEPEPVAAGAQGAPERERPRKRVPASGYATVHEPGSYGNADPDELLKSFVRSILRRLPG
ncbi:MAG: hypothetical protein FGM34_07735 [Solirubrobacteraceae bacterium]|nr:hypothetical protein [Solirubrobacteraceae bacterium]